MILLTTSDAKLVFAKHLRGLNDRLPICTGRLSRLARPSALCRLLPILSISVPYPKLTFAIRPGHSTLDLVVDMSGKTQPVSVAISNQQFT